jgi:hypothetical protein
VEDFQTDIPVEGKSMRIERSLDAELSIDSRLPAVCIAMTTLIGQI